MKKILKRILILTTVFGSLSLGLTNCSSDDNNDGIPGLNLKKMKLTVTVNGVQENDIVTFNATTTSVYNDQPVLWKVNGADKPNEPIVNLDQQNFLGSTKTYVIESAVDLPAANVMLYIAPYTDHLLTYSYKAEVNGNVVKDEQNIPITNPNTFSVTYTY